MNNKMGNGIGSLVKGMAQAPGREGGMGDKVSAMAKARNNARMMARGANAPRMPMRGGGMAQKGMAKGGLVKANGCAQRGKTRGKMV